MKSHDLAHQLLSLPNRDLEYDDGEECWSIDEVSDEGDAIILATEEDEDAEGETIDAEVVDAEFVR